MPISTSSSSAVQPVGKMSTVIYVTKSIWQSKWLVLAVSLWLQACAGVGYAFGSYSSLVKSELGYSQQQITILGISKDLGGSIGLIAGSLSEVIPTWCLLTVGALQNLIGYGWIWLIVTRRTSVLPIWAVCFLIFVGTNGETYFNTAALVTNVRNFPKSRGHVAGLLKGFCGLCSAIFTQIYVTFFAPDQGAYLAIVALGPTAVSLLVMFVIRPIKTERTFQETRSESWGFAFIYGDCGILAAYLMGALIVQDVVTLSFKVRLMIFLILLALVALPLMTPLVSWAAARRKNQEEEERMHEEVQEETRMHIAMDEDDKGAEVPLLRSSEKQCTGHSLQRERHEMDIPEIGFTSGDLGHPRFGPESRAGSFSGSVGTSELEDENPADIDMLTEPERTKIILEFRKRILRAAAEGAMGIKKGKVPYREEDFTLRQVVVKADFWLLFFIFLCGAGTGLAAIDNMGQISQSQGYPNSSVFVSMTSIFNFVGRLLGGYFSEILSRNYGLPRSWALGMAQGLMAVGYFVIAMAWPGTLYAGTLLVGTGYGAHWGIIPPIISELFGMKSFGILYNVYIMAPTVGVLFFSGFLAGYLYDVEAAKQHTGPSTTSALHTQFLGFTFASTSSSCLGAVCFRSTFLIMMGVCIFAILLTSILSIRTRRVYKALYKSITSYSERPV